MYQKYSIGTMAKLMGISAEAIRYYESRNIISPVRDPETGYRYYNTWDFHMLLRARHYQNYGFSLEEIAELFRSHELGEIRGKMVDQEEEENVHYTDLETVLKNSDYVSLHCPLTPATRHLINADTLVLMKPTAFLINTSRGALIDEPALIKALQEHKIAGAGLDVQETEPPVEDNPLYTLDNVILTPHMGWKGLETRQRLLSILKGNIDGFINGKPVNVVS